ncbi:MAG TPA: hypothetical protein DCY26_07955 [Hyphomonas sp.]|nr:hypothetical protein [Hyphomonas sp.]
MIESAKDSGHYLESAKDSGHYRQEAVTTLLENCDAALIDVTDLNENTRWELQEAHRQIGPGCLILSYQVSLGEHPAAPSEHLIRQVAEVIGENDARLVLWFGYPETKWADPRSEAHWAAESDLQADLEASFAEVFACRDQIRAGQTCPAE